MKKRHLSQNIQLNKAVKESSESLDSDIFFDNIPKREGGE